MAVAGISNVDSVSNEKIVIGALRNCNQKSEILDVFNKFKITSVAKKRELILKSMGDATTYYCGDNISEEKKLDGDIYMFLDGEWRAHEVYTIPKK